MSSSALASMRALKAVSQLVAAVLKSSQSPPSVATPTVISTYALASAEKSLSQHSTVVESATIPESAVGNAPQNKVHSIPVALAAAALTSTSNPVHYVFAPAEESGRFVLAS